MEQSAVLIINEKKSLLTISIKRRRSPTSISLKPFLNPRSPFSPCSRIRHGGIPPAAAELYSALGGHSACLPPSSAAPSFWIALPQERRHVGLRFRYFRSGGGTVAWTEGSRDLQGGVRGRIPHRLHRDRQDCQVCERSGCHHYG